MKLKWIALALRVGLGALFVIAGALKLGDPMRFAIEVTNYRLLPALAPYLAVILPPVEVVLGLSLIAMPRTWRRAAALALTALMAVFTVAVAQVVARGINVDCGCFGGASGPVDGWTVARDFALLAVAAVVLVLESKRGASPRATE